MGFSFTVFCMRSRIHDEWPQAPRGLRVTEFDLDGASLVVLSFPLDARALPPSLTRAEREIAEGLLASQTTAELARTRGTSVGTVTKQVAALFAKVGVRSRSEFVACVSGAEESRTATERP